MMQLKKIIFVAFFLSCTGISGVPLDNKALQKKRYQANKALKERRVKELYSKAIEGFSGTLKIKSFDDYRKPTLTRYLLDHKLSDQPAKIFENIGRSELILNEFDSWQWRDYCMPYALWRLFTLTYGYEHEAILLHTLYEAFNDKMKQQGGMDLSEPLESMNALLGALGIQQKLKHKRWYSEGKFYAFVLLWGKLIDKPVIASTKEDHVLTLIDSSGSWHNPKFYGVDYDEIVRVDPISIDISDGVLYFADKKSKK